MAAYGIFGLIGWVLSGCGAMALSLVFASLCSRFPRTGGPHVYIEHLFGPTAAFFTGWTYWVISYVSTAVVVITAISSLNPFLTNISQFAEVTLQIILLMLMTLLNLRGVQASSKAEFILILLTLFRSLLYLLPLFHFDSTRLS